MSYFMEISANIKKNSDISKIKTSIINLANEHRLKNHYEEYEFIGKNRQVFRNHFVISLIFEEHDELLALFIKKIKMIKKVKIECIAFDDIVYKLMYASRNYLNLMEKSHAKEYLEKQRNGLLYKQDSVIFKAIKKKCN